MLQVEGKLRHLANPHCEERMKLILSLKETASSSDGSSAAEDEKLDEVSFIYYGDHCTCSKLAKCQSTKCLCFIRGVKCGISCHSEGNSKCSNK